MDGKLISFNWSKNSALCFSQIPWLSPGNGLMPCSFWHHEQELDLLVVGLGSLSEFTFMCKVSTKAAWVASYFLILLTLFYWHFDVFMMRKQIYQPPPAGRRFRWGVDCPGRIARRDSKFYKSPSAFVRWRRRDRECSGVWVASEVFSTRSFRR